MRKMFVWTPLMFCLLLATGAQAQQGGKAKADNSGTNPINFTNDFRIWNETQDLNGDNTFSKLTFEYRFPLGKTWAARFRGYVPTLNLADGRSFHGLGDVDARILHVPLVKKKWAIALGLEATLNSATQPFVGFGRTTLGPQVFLVLFEPLGIKNVLFAPAFQHVIDIGGDEDRVEIDRSAIDLFLLWLAPNKKHWVMFNPQIILDYEGDKETVLIETEVGQMMFGATSSYIRPGFHAAGDKLFNWNIEFGFKVIWR